MSEWISNHADQFVNVETTLFEKPRETNKDRGLKFKTIELYNALKEKFGRDSSLLDVADIGIPCDLMLDLLRYERQEVMNVELVVKEFQEKGNTFAGTHVKKGVSCPFTKEIVDSIL